MGPDELLVTALQYAHTASTYSSFITTKLFSLSAPLRSYVADGSNRDLTNVILLLVIVWLSIHILDMATRWIRWLLRLIFRLVFLALAVGFGLWVWTKGPAEVLTTLEIWARLLMEETKKGQEEGYDWGKKSSHDRWNSAGWRDGL